MKIDRLMIIVRVDICSEFVSVSIKLMSIWGYSMFNQKNPSYVISEHEMLGFSNAIAAYELSESSMWKVSLLLPLVAS